MAVALEFIDLIVPIARIRTKYPGGWDQCLQDHEFLIGGRVWFDGHLFRDGAMSSRHTELTVDGWRKRGFEPCSEADGKPFWNDYCVVESMFTSGNLPCDWIDFTDDGGAVFGLLAGG